MARQLIGLHLNCIQFGLHYVFLTFTFCSTKANSIQFQQGQAVLGGHFHFTENIWKKKKKKQRKQKTLIHQLSDQFNIITYIHSIFLGKSEMLLSYPSRSSLLSHILKPSVKGIKVLSTFPFKLWTTICVYSESKTGNLMNSLNCK